MRLTALSCSSAPPPHVLVLVLCDDDVVAGEEVTWLKPGAKAASDNLEDFMRRRLKGFAELSNDPNKDVCSHMSPYFNMGQMSAQAAVLRVKKAKSYPDGVKAFIEQSVVRRELSDNLCFYNGECLTDGCPATDSLMRRAEARFPSSMRFLDFGCSISFDFVRFHWASFGLTRFTLPR